MRQASIIFCLIICCFFSSCASAKKIYASVFLSTQLGMQMIHIKGGSLHGVLGMPNYTADDQKAFADRYAFGFYLSHYFSLEAGYISLDTYSTKLCTGTIIGDLTGVIHRELSAYDIIASGFIPIHHFFFRIGAGAAFVDSQYLPVSVDLDGSVFPYDLDGDYHTTFIRPKLILGFGYWLSKNFLLSINYSRVFHIGKTLQEDITLCLPTIDMLTIGMSIVFP